MDVNTKTISAAMDIHYNMQDIAARNVANIETPGFKRVLARVGSTVEDAETGEIPKVIGVQVDLTQGDLQQTGNVLDVAIKGDGFFTIHTKNGLRYTRNGSFCLDQDRMLITQDGDKVAEKSGEIQIPPGVNSVTIDATGKIMADNSEIDTLMINRFENPELVRQGGKCQYIGDNANPTEVDPGDPNMEIHQGFLERSNVSAVTELVNMMASYREYEACAHSLKAITEIAGKLYSWAQS